LPDHWHAILFPPHPLTISRVMEAIKVGSTHRINAGRWESGLLWQPRFPSAGLRACFDRALRTVKEYHEKAEYIHLNPVRAGLVKRAEDWPWSSARDYTGSVSAAVSPHRVLAIDRILLPADERTRI
jgi:putative transposase